MRRLIKIMGALAIVAVSFFATLWGMNYAWPGCPSGREIALTRPFQRSAPPGFGYVKELPKLESSGGTPPRLLLCENNSVLGPMDAPHTDIAKVGGGRYSHWGNTMVFSASDNSDPNTNGRSYSAVQVR